MGFLARPCIHLNPIIYKFEFDNTPTLHIAFLKSQYVLAPTLLLACI